MLIISLSGGSGSGKTTLANQIVSRFPIGYITLFPMDAYYNDHAHLTTDEKMNHNFDHPKAMDFDLLIRHLHQLKSGIPIQRPVYSFLTCGRQPYTVPVYPSGIILLDGFMALVNENLRNCIDFKIFVEVSENNRLERIIKRDENERGRTKYLVMDRFYKTVQPMHEKFIEPSKYFADITIDGNPTNIQAITGNIEFAICHKLHANFKNNYYAPKYQS